MKTNSCTVALLAFLVFGVNACSRPTTGETQAIAPSKPIPVRVSLDGTDAAEPAIAASQDGSIFVAWVEHQPEGKADVFVRKIAPDKTQSTPVRVNTEAGNATAWRGDPPTIAIAPDGVMYVVWTSKAAAKGHENNLYLSISRDSGVSFGKPIKINDDEKPGVHGMHSFAIDKQGRIYFAWLDERNLKPAAPMTKHRGEAHAMERNREVFVAYSEDGGVTISKNQMIANEACPCCKTAIAVSPDGNVYVGWRQVLAGELRHIAIASSTDRGKTFVKPIIVSDDQWVIAGCPVSGPALSAGNIGNLTVLWYTAGGAGTQGLYASRSTDGGRTFATRQLVSAGVVFGNPSLLFEPKSNHLFAVWQSGDSGLMRAEMASDGSINNTMSLQSSGKLPAATLDTGQTVLAYISTVDNQRSIWLVVDSKISPTVNL